MVWPGVHAAVGGVTDRLERVLAWRQHLLPPRVGFGHEVRDQPASCSPFETNAGKQKSWPALVMSLSVAKGDLDAAVQPTIVVHPPAADKEPPDIPDMEASKRRYCTPVALDAGLGLRYEVDWPRLLFTDLRLECCRLPPRHYGVNLKLTVNQLILTYSSDIIK